MGGGEVGEWYYTFLKTKGHSVNFKTVLSKVPKLKFFPQCLSAFYFNILILKEEEVVSTF